jgi:hypothetical protein
MSRYLEVYITMIVCTDLVACFAQLPKVRKVVRALLKYSCLNAADPDFSLKLPSLPHAAVLRPPHSRCI